MVPDQFPTVRRTKAGKTRQTAPSDGQVGGSERSLGGWEAMTSRLVSNQVLGPERRNPHQH